MAIAVTHTFVATGSETAGAAAAGKVVTSEWNAAHSLTGFGTGVAAALAVNVGSAGAPVLFNGAGGTPSSIALTNATALPIGSVTGLGTGVATWLATPTYANLSSAVTGATIAVLGTAQNFTAAQTNLQSIAATSTDGWVLSNTTAAAAGAQQWSPRLRLTGQGWKTDATAASQAVDWIIENQSVQGAAAPDTRLIFAAQVNGGGYSTGLNSLGGLVTNGSGRGAVWGTTRFENGNWYLWSFNTQSTAMARSYTNAVMCADSGNGGFMVGSALKYMWCSGADLSGFTADLILSRSAAATLQQGDANAASPVAQTLQAQGSRTATDNNVAGAQFTIRPGKGTGSVAPNPLILQSYVAVAGGTGAQTATDTITLNSGNATMGGMLITKGYAIGSLPTGVTGAVVHVTDQITAPAAKGIAPTAGGAIKCLVMFDGTNWVGV